MKKLSIVIGGILGLFCLSANSAGTSGEVSLENARIQLISTGTPIAYVYDTPVNDGCEKTFPVLIFDGPDANPLAKEIYSTLLMAKASGKKVNIITKGCWSVLSTPIITSMYLLN